MSFSSNQSLTELTESTTGERLSRRSMLLKGASTALAGLNVLRVAGPANLFGQSGNEVIPWVDQPPPNPFPAGVGNLLNWEALDQRLTPAQNFFYVDHYGIPANLDESRWHLSISGLVARPRSLTIADIKARPRAEVEFTLECSGNTGIPFFIGGIGNARWAGARLTALLEQAQILDNASEVIFWGADSGPVTIRDNSGVLTAGTTGKGEPDTSGGIDLTITEQFARSMSVEEATARDNLLCYEMNGQALPPEHGFPLRLIAPGWYGVANVKWLTRIEVTDRRFAGRFMSRDYVTFREETRDGQTAWIFTTVGRERVKSAPARVIRRNGGYAITGAAWGAPIASVEVQIDREPWRAARLDDVPQDRSRRFAWRFWNFDWGNATGGEHTVTSRATDTAGNNQFATTDAFIAGKTTYWESSGQITRRVILR